MQLVIRVSGCDSTVAGRWRDAAAAAGVAGHTLIYLSLSHNLWYLTCLLFHSHRYKSCHPKCLLHTRMASSFAWHPLFLIIKSQMSTFIMKDLLIKKIHWNNQTCLFCMHSKSQQLWKLAFHANTIDLWGCSGQNQQCVNWGSQESRTWRVCVQDKQTWRMWPTVWPVPAILPPSCAHIALNGTYFFILSCKQAPGSCHKFCKWQGSRLAPCFTPSLLYRSFPILFVMHHSSHKNKVYFSKAKPDHQFSAINNVEFAEKLDWYYHLNKNMHN